MLSSSAHERMDGDAARPHKRPRHTGQPFSNSVYIGSAEEQQQRSGGPSVGPQDSEKNARQEQSPQLAPPRGRPEEKHRKLSCKECRRWVLPRLLSYQSNHVPRCPPSSSRCILRIIPYFIEIIAMFSL